MLQDRLYTKKAAAVIILLLVLSVCTSCGFKAIKSTKSTVNVARTLQQTEEQTKTFTGVVTNVDRDLKQVTIRELDHDIDTILDYNATAVIKDKYGGEITGGELEPGYIMEVTYNTEKLNVITMKVPKDVWEYQDASKFSFDGDEKAINIAGKKYQYTNWTYFSNLENKIEMMELDSQDIITVRGIGITVYSVTRTSGHGYIKFSNYDTFLGGMVCIGDSIVLPVTENMFVTAGAGSYRVTLSKGGLNAVKNVTIEDGMEVTLDFSGYKEEPGNIGNITFNIEPYGADLYINNTLVAYDDPVALNYGEYKVRAELGGYTTYNGILDVERPDSIINIELTSEKAASTAKATGTPSPSGSKDDNVTTKTIDSNHKITISAPEGAEVYLDNVYKGLAPCSFTKIIGSQTVTLRSPGYVTKSYSIDVLDDGKDVKLSFSELVEDSD